MLFCDFVYQPVLIGKPARPKALQLMLQRLRFANTPERIARDFGDHSLQALEHLFVI